MYSLRLSNVHYASCKCRLGKLLWLYHCNGASLSPVHRAFPLLLFSGASTSSRSVQKRFLPNAQDESEQNIITPDDLSGETNTLVTEVMDIDRTPELLTWLFGGLFAKKQADQTPTNSASPSFLAAPQHPDLLPEDAFIALKQPSTLQSADNLALECRQDDGSTASMCDTASSSPTIASQQQVGSPLPFQQQPAGATTANTHTWDSGPAPPEQQEGLTEGSSKCATAQPGAQTHQSAAATSADRTEVAVVGGGCFWCIEAAFADLQGVVSATSGYSGGHLPNPTYQQVLSKITGHAEVVRVEYDPDVLSYKDVLQIFLSLHDPTTPNRSGPDVGPQYRSIILTTSSQQHRVAEQVLSEANRARGWFGRKVVTELAPLQAFYPAESYHQRYFARHQGSRYCVLVVAPKLQEFRRKYLRRLRRDSTSSAAGCL